MERSDQGNGPQGNGPQGNGSQGNGSNDKGLHIGLSVLLGLAVIGFFVGTLAPGEEPAHLPVAEAQAMDEGELRSAPSYAEMRLATPNEGSWEEESARFVGPGRLDPVSLEGTSKTIALRDRSENRAYDGAPPTIPHAVRQGSAAECMACHEEGLQIRDRLATAIPHDDFLSCTQCHVVEAQPMPGETLGPDQTFVDNRFVGLASPVQGDRAWSIAPPTSPHSSMMRENCMACHGPNGRDAMRSTHPDRQECKQCHGLSGELENMPASFGVP